MTLPDIALFPNLLKTFARLGECYQEELELGSSAWIVELLEGGWLKQTGSGSYCATSKLRYLFKTRSEVEQQRYVSFAIPAFRRHLLVILLENLVLAAQTEFDEFETWLFHDLCSIAGELNTVLDFFENDGYRLIERAQPDVQMAFEAWHERNRIPTAWNRHLLGGMNLSPVDLFQPIKDRIQYFEHVHSPENEQRTVALFVQFALPVNKEGHLRLPEYGQDYVMRREVCGTLPLFARKGQPLFAAHSPPNDVWADAFAHQPYYRAVLRVAIAARFSRYDAARMVLQVGEGLQDIRVVRNKRKLITITQVLASLVRILGFEPYTDVTDEMVEQIVTHWIYAQAIEVRDGQLELSESYADSLHVPPRAKLLLRGAGGVEQEHVKQFLLSLD
ncbi:MAG: hypothetical protein R2851_15500 [Caldilineaceae bacterium]